MSFQSECEEKKKRIILTGATGYVGEGVLLECLAHDSIGDVLIVGRRHYNGPTSLKIKELIIPNFFDLDGVEDQLKEYDACFYCAGSSSVGKSESEYSHLNYDTVMHFANKLVKLNARMIFCFISGSFGGNSKSKQPMWIRVKWRIERELSQLPFQAVYSFRPRLMKPIPGQQNMRCFYGVVLYLLCCFTCNFTSCCGCCGCCSELGCSLEEVGLSMIKCVLGGYGGNRTLEVRDMVRLANV
jgi:hypothetical protein